MMMIQFSIKAKDSRVLWVSMGGEVGLNLRYKDQETRNDVLQ